MALFLAEVIDHGLQTLARHMNITEEPAKRLNMKNEFYLTKIIFTDAKKRYVSNTVLQEGQLLNNGLGKPDYKNSLDNIFRIIETLKCEPIAYI